MQVHIVFNCFFMHLVLIHNAFSEYFSSIPYYDIYTTPCYLHYSTSTCCSTILQNNSQVYLRWYIITDHLWSHMYIYKKSVSNWSEIVHINFNKFVEMLNSNNWFPAVTIKDFWYRFPNLFLHNLNLTKVLNLRLWLKRPSSPGTIEVQYVHRSPEWSNIAKHAHNFRVLGYAPSIL